MATYSEKNSLTLLNGAVDPNGVPIVVASVNGNTSFESVDFVLTGGSGGTVQVTTDGVVTLDDTTLNSPALNVTATAGTFSFTLTNGTHESPTYVASVSVTGITIGNPDTGFVPGAVHYWHADAGIQETGGVITGWVDQISGLVLPATDAPTVGTSPGGAQMITLDGADTFLKSDGVGAMPTGVAGRTIMLVGRIEPGSENWGGFSYGGNAAGESFGLIVDGIENTIDLDFKDERISGPDVSDGNWFVATGTYDGSVAELYFGKNLIASDTALINTSSSQVNVMRSYSGKARNGNVGAIFIYPFVLTAAQIAQMVDQMNTDFLNDFTGPVLGVPDLVATSDSTGTASGTIGDDHGTVWGVVTASAAAPSPEQVAEGLDHTWTPAIASFEIYPQAGAFSQPLTGLVSGQEQFLHLVAADSIGNVTTVQSSTGVTPQAEPAPTVITPTNVTLADTTAPGAQIVLFSADQPVTSWSQQTPLVAGLDISATGNLTLTAALTTGVYQLNVRASNAGGDYDQVVPVNVTQNSATADYTVANWAALVTLLDSWSGTVPGGAPVTVEIQGPTSANIDLSGRVFDHLVTVRAVGTTAPTFSTSTVGGQTVYNFGTQADLVGTLDLTGAQNIRFFRINQQGGHTVDDSVDITFENCVLSGQPYDPAIGTTTATGGTGQLAIPTDYTRLTYLNCHLDYVDNAFLMFKGGADARVEGCTFGWQRHDCLKVQGANQNMKIYNNWLSRRVNQYDGAHVDFCQHQPGLDTNEHFRGNVMWKGIRVGSQGSQQGWFNGGNNSSTQQDALVEQNIHCSTGANAFVLELNNGGNVLKDNDMIRVFVGNASNDTEQGGSWPRVNGGWATNENNIGQSKNGTQGNFGTGQVNIDMDWTPSDGGKFWTDFQQGDFLQFYSAYPTSDNNDIVDWLLPPSTSARTHWNTTDGAGTVGAATRKKEIIVDGLHPGNAGWPVDGPWTDQFNQSGGLTSAFSGSWDVNGDPV